MRRLIRIDAIVRERRAADTEAAAGVPGTSR
jgi:hypothetical protein